MNKSEAMGHIAVGTFAGSLGLLGLGGILIGIIIFISWVLYESK